MSQEERESSMQEEFEEEPEFQSEKFSSSVPEERMGSQSYAIEAELPDPKETYSIEETEINLAALDMNSLFRLSTELKTLREKLYLNSEKLWNQKNQFDEALADKNAQIEYLYRELSRVERERDTYKSERDEFEFKGEQAQSTFQKKTEEMNGKLSKFEHEGIKFFSSQNDLSRLQMENELIKANLERSTTEINNLKRVNTEITTENYELRKIVKENRDLSQNNQTYSLNLGIPAYKTQLGLSIDDFNALGLSKEVLNLDINNVYEFCGLLLRKLKEINSKVRYYEENDFERKANDAREENYKLREDLLMLEKLRDNLINLNKDLQVRNEELLEANIKAGRINEILMQKEIENKSKDEIILQKDKIIQELQRLIEIYESQIFSKEHLKDADRMEEEIEQDESKKNLIEKYNKLKQEWIVLMKDYKDLRQTIIHYQERDAQNAEKYEESFLNSLIRENTELKEANKKLEEDNHKYYEHALEKVQQFKGIARELLGWDIRIKNEMIEMRSALNPNEAEVLVLKQDDEGKYVILDIEEFGKKLFTSFPHLIELKDISYPLFFAYVSFMMKPEFKQLLLL